MKVRHRFAGKFAALFIGLVPAFAQAAPSFTGLGDFAGGPIESQAYAIAADGTAVVGYGTIAGTEFGNYSHMGFRWTSSTGLQQIGDLPGGMTYSDAFGVNNNGSIVVGASGADNGSGGNGQMSFTWTSGGGIQGIGYGYAGHGESAKSLTNDGSVIVGSAASSPNVLAYRWTPGGGFQTLASQSGFSISSTGVSADGNTVVGFEQPSGNFQGWVWTPGDGLQLLADLADGTTETYASAVSRNGAYIVGDGNDATGQRAVLWTNGVPQAITPAGPPFSFSRAAGVSDDGTIVGGFGLSTAFIWDPVHGAEPASEVFALGGISIPAGWQLSAITGVSADGLSYTGYGFDPASHIEAWYAHLDVSPMVPEPATRFTLLAVLLVAALAARRHRCRCPSCES